MVGGLGIEGEIGSINSRARFAHVWWVFCQIGPRNRAPRTLHVPATRTSPPATGHPERWAENAEIQGELTRIFAILRNLPPRGEVWQFIRPRCHAGYRTHLPRDRL
jgi:hypothetical protein